MECVQSEGVEFSSPAKKGKKLYRTKTNPAAQPMDLEVPAASETTAAPVELSSTFETHTHEQDDAALPYTDQHTKYLHKLCDKTLLSLKASWIGPANCTVNTTETDTVEKARSEWVVVHDAPFDPKVDKLSSGAAFVCVDIREPFDHEVSYIVSSIAALAPKINRGGCVIIVGSAEQVCFQTIVFQ